MANKFLRLKVCSANLKLRISLCIYHEPMKAFLVCASNRSLKMVCGVNLQKYFGIEPRFSCLDLQIKQLKILVCISNF